MPSSSRSPSVELVRPFVFSSRPLDDSDFFCSSVYDRIVDDTDFVSSSSENRVQFLSQSLGAGSGPGLYDFSKPSDFDLENFERIDKGLSSMVLALRDGKLTPDDISTLRTKLMDAVEHSKSEHERALAEQALEEVVAARQSHLDKSTGFEPPDVSKS
ncbi:hypothetical protein [Capybara microvirus Cap3_SP_320]|nr:hypothetical protein [Capybara microvirus Cap3_SP_320]